MKQYVVTPAAGKRLIAKAIVAHPAIRQALEFGTVVIVAGTTNGYIAEEILRDIGEDKNFDKRRFFRGVTLPPSQPTTKAGRLQDECHFPGDVVIVNGFWQQGKTIFDVADDLNESDVILKGANAVDLSSQRAGILIGHPQAGTIAVALQAVAGRRVQLILPVGLEKRVHTDLDKVAEILNSAGAEGPRFLPVPGKIFTELQAINLLTGATAELVAGGGVDGAEGSVWLAVSGDDQQEKEACKLLGEVADESPFAL